MPKTPHSPDQDQEDFLPRLSAPQEGGPQQTFCFEVTISLLGIPCRQCGNILEIFDNLLFSINLQISVVGTFDADNKFLIECGVVH